MCDKCANGGVGELRTCPEGAQGSCVIEITKSQKPELEGESSRDCPSNIHIFLSFKVTVVEYLRVCNNNLVMAGLG